MLPIGIIAAIVLIFLYGGGRYPGGLFFALLAILLVLFVVRVAFRLSRRRHWRQQREQNRPVRILRERYARGEITKEQFDQMMRDLRRHQ